MEVIKIEVRVQVCKALLELYGLSCSYIQSAYYWNPLRSWEVF